MFSSSHRLSFLLLFTSFEIEHLQNQESWQKPNEIGSRNKTVTRVGFLLIVTLLQAIISHILVIGHTFNFQWYLQKQPSRDVLRKRCSENMQQIYRSIPMPNCDFNKVAKATFLKSHSDIDVFLLICCIFSEHLFLRAPLKGCFCTSIFSLTRPVNAAFKTLLYISTIQTEIQFLFLFHVHFHSYLFIIFKTVHYI